LAAHSHWFCASVKIEPAEMIPAVLTNSRRVHVLVVI